MFFFLFFYRKERLLCTRTGSSSSKWPYYWLLHSLLGSLPMNDEFLVEENIEVPEVRELPEGGQVIGSWEDSAALEADGDVAASEPAETLTASRDAIHDEASSPLCSMDGPARDTSKSKLATGRKRPATVVQSILASHKEEMVYVRKSDKKRQKLLRKLVHLQEESNDMNASMMRMIGKYFESKTNKQ
ncbi:uncharacterized protein LOC125944502 [Dermacentor silvarum]|nr:uncharacterized protein LOC125944502 [Dermacentor silvarum]